MINPLHVKPNLSSRAGVQGRSSLSSSSSSVVTDIRDCNQNTPLLRAILDGRESMARELIAPSSYLNQQNILGFTPLYASLSVGLHLLVAPLLWAGADTNVCSLDGASPAHLASSQGSDSILVSLIQHGAHLNKQDDEGDTPLHWAVREGRESTVALLLAHGANPHLVNEDGEAPLHLALQLNEQAIAKLLITAGAKHNSADTVSNPSLEDAKSRGNIHMMQIFNNKLTSTNNGNFSLPSAHTFTPANPPSPLFPFVASARTHPSNHHTPSIASSSSQFDECKSNVSSVGASLVALSVANRS